MKKSVVKVKRKILNEKLGEIHNEDTICKNNNFDSIDGKLYYTKNNNEFKIISHPYKTQHKNEHKYVDIQFTKTKYITSANILIMTINKLCKYLHYGYYNTKKEKINIYEKNSKGR